MSAQSREVPVDVLPPLPPDALVPPTHLATGHLSPMSGLRTFYHPASGVAILGVDLLCFGPEVFLPFDLPFMCVFAFLVTLPLVYLVQWKWSKDTMAASFGKAFLGAFLAGLPFSITGTIFGAAVLVMSGLPRNPWEALKRMTSGAPKLPE
jgi:hypothetical protein